MKKNKLMQIISVLAIIGIVSSNNIYAVLSDEAKELEQEKEENEQKVDEMKEELEELEQEKESTIEEVTKISNEIYSYEAEIAELNSKIASLNSEIEQAEKDIEEREEEYNKRQGILESRLIATYETGDVTYLDVLLSSGNIIELISNYYLLQELANSDVEFLEGIQNEKKEIEEAKVELEKDKKEVDESKSELQAITNQLEASKTQKNQEIANLTEQEKETQERLDELEAANKKIEAEIKAAEEKYQKELEALKNQQASASTGTSTGSGYFMKPTDGYVSATSYYSSGKFHGAIDYAVNTGTPVYAAAAGVVMSTASLSGSYRYIYCN